MILSVKVMKAGYRSFVARSAIINDLLRMHQGANVEGPRARDLSRAFELIGKGANQHILRIPISVAKVFPRTTLRLRMRS